MSRMGESPFDDTYFARGPYAEVSFRRFGQYWWSTRFYALLALRYGPPSGRLLEVGCGLGHLLARLQHRYSVYGIDINSWALERAAETAPGAVLKEGSAEDLSHFEESDFDLLIAKHVLEHLSNPEAAVAEFGRVLAPGGVAILATPNLDSPMRARKGDRWIGYKDPTHISLRRPQEWLDVLQSAELQPIRVISDGFWDPPYVAWLPRILQRIMFGLPGGFQAVVGLPLLPLRWGESMIVVARKRRNGGG
jgi:SAM-dependent methyltransferase